MLSLRQRLYVVIFEHDTRAGKLFDVALLWLVLLSVVVVIAESVDGVRNDYGQLLRSGEWFLTVLFSVEYALRVYSARRRLAYVFSFYGLVDFLAITPTFVALLVPGAMSLVVVRVLRLLRVFRVLKLASFHGEGDALLRALRASSPKIIVFLGAVLSIVVIVGSAMYVIEGPANGFTNIPRSMYWAIVTLTTVGYGDIAPRTAVGQIVASTLMILGYAIIAVPTGIVSAEMSRVRRRASTECGACGAAEARDDARYCRCCGELLRVAGPQSPSR